MHNIQKILYKSICHFVGNYDDYKHLMPVSEKIYDILSLCKQKPYRPGTYRTDFLIDENNQIKLIEITCRFALNGFFMSGFSNLLADQFLKDKPNIKKIDEYTAYYDYLMEYFGEFYHICFLKGGVHYNESKYAVPILEKAGYKVHVIAADTITENLHLLKNAAVIGELNYTQLYNLPMETIETIICSNLLNDLRTVFLIHDKRFFSVLGKDVFLRAALSPDESDELKKYLVPAYTWRERQDLWLNAKKEKDNWIIKPCAQGASTNVFAGCVTSDQEWQKLFSSDEMEDIVLQPYIKQRKIKGSVGKNHYEDYVVGTLLFFDNNFFGPGIFRASSYPITNKVDDRKIAPLVTADMEYFDDGIIL